MKRSTALGLLLALILALGAMLAVDIANPPPSRARGVLVLGVDSSTSVIKDCNGIIGAARDHLAVMDLGQGSRVGFIGIGSSGTRFEPQLLMDEEIVRRGGRRGQAEIDELLEKLRKACQSMPAADGSAIARAVRIGLAHIEAKCGGAADCQGRLVLATDGEENISASVRDLLAGVKPKGKKAAPVVPILNNSLPKDLLVVMCGYTATSEGGAPRTNDALLDRWRGLFARPDGVRFEPYCTGKSGAPALLE